MFVKSSKDKECYTGLQNISNNQALFNILKQYKCAWVLF